MKLIVARGIPGYASAASQETRQDGDGTAASLPSRGSEAMRPPVNPKNASSGLLLRGGRQRGATAGQSRASSTSSRSRRCPAPGLGLTRLIYMITWRPSRQPSRRCPTGDHLVLYGAGKNRRGVLPAFSDATSARASVGRGASPGRRPGQVLATCPTPTQYRPVYVETEAPP